MSRSNQIVVPGCKAALDQMKYEIAAELGLMSGGGSFDSEFADELGAAGGANSAGHVNWSSITTRQAGFVGGNITKRLVAQAEQVLKGL